VIKGQRSKSSVFETFAKLKNTEIDEETLERRGVMGDKKH